MASELKIDSIKTTELTTTKGLKVTDSYVEFSGIPLAKDGDKKLFYLVVNAKGEVSKLPRK